MLAYLPPPLPLFIGGFLLSALQFPLLFSTGSHSLAGMEIAM